MLFARTRSLFIFLPVPVRCIKDKPSQFAKVLYKSMKGAGTDDNSLMRVVVSRAEIDMVQIKEAFQQEYGKTLASFISVSVNLKMNETSP